MIGYFSGTGNSRWVAQRLGELIGDKVFSITSVDSPDISHFSVLVFPIYAWGAPKWVKKVLENAVLPKKIDVILTCGDDIGMTDFTLRRLLLHRNCILRSCHSIQMPNSYVALPGFDVDSYEVVQQKKTNAEIRIQIIAERLKKSQEIVDVVRGSIPRIKSYVLRPLFNKFLTGDKRFKVDESLCIHCNKCVKICPVQNIKMNAQNVPEWQHHCADCSACFHICPSHAINHNSFTKKKGQKEILLY